MEKIYGYKEEDILGLAEYMHQNRYKSLSEMFVSYGKIIGKAKGTVRNLYYAVAKMSRIDQEFCRKYFDGVPLSVSKIEQFDEQEERGLIKKILLEKNQGRSARSVIMELAGGDGKVALRYQNKFRNAIKNKTHLVAEIIKELKDEGNIIEQMASENKEQSLISDAQFYKLKNEIDNLVRRISTKREKENEQLKYRISLLERENLRLSNLLYAEGKRQGVARFFKVRGNEDMLN